jgi:hypothetical protein
MNVSHQVPEEVCGVVTRTCVGCGAEALGDAWRCLSCGRPFFGIPMAEARPASEEKRYYGSEGSRRRVRSTEMLALLVHASLGE